MSTDAHNVEHAETAIGHQPSAVGTVADGRQPTADSPWPELAPFDEHNETLLNHTHPPDWTNPTPPEGPSGRYNLVVIGAGTAGLVSAAGAAGLGAKVALIERKLMGGDCLNTGCVPSKALIRCAKVAADARRTEQYGVEVTGDVRVDFPAIMQRMRKLRAKISPHDSAARFRDLGVDVFIGDAAFTGSHQIKVGEATLEFSRAVIATGGHATAPPIPGLKEAGFLTNETLFSLTELPPRLAIIGAGPIGCEMAQTFARFGSEVTIIEATGHILPREDADAAEIIDRALREDGVTIVCGGKAAKVRTDGDEKIIDLECEGKQHELRIDEILVSAGRSPNIDGLNLEAAGVEADARKGITVNDYLQTTNGHIYAAGDVASKYQFTHAADAMARIVLQNALFFGRGKASRLIMPWCTYTDPEIAHVGLYEKDAKEQGIETETITIQLGDNDRAILDGETDGFLRIIHKKGSDKILGATLVSRHAGETISEVTAAMTAGAGLGTLAKTIHPYPTQAEVIKRAADAYSRTRLTPFVKKIFTKLLEWRR
jgi:pyruvate/2-oxoglutarate dehydrogenase complex dihydrolipoamide dehydrogenase (E3) component